MTHKVKGNTTIDATFLATSRKVNARVDVTFMRVIVEWLLNANTYSIRVQRRSF